MDLKDYFRIIYKYLWIGLLFALVGIVAGFALNWQTKIAPLYDATSTVMVGGDLATVEANSVYMQLADQFTATYADLATREPIMQSVIDQLHLKTTPSELKNFISAEIVEGTQLIEITASDNNAKQAAAIANATARQLDLYSPRVVRNFVLTIEDAKVPSFPSMGFFLIPIVCGILGFLFSLGIAFLREFSRNPIYSADELTDRTALPVLATIRPKGKSSLRESLARRKLPGWMKVNDAAWWPLITACRQHFKSLAIPTNPHPRPPIVLVTSPGENKQKSMVATNLASAWARTGDRVILIDADFDSPVLHKWFKTPQGPGLADLLAQPEDSTLAEKALYTTEIPNLSLLPLGKPDGNTYQYLDNCKFSQVLENLGQFADAFVVDGSAVLSGPEAAIIASRAHEVLLALNAGDTSIDAAEDARDSLAMAQSNLLGAILVDGVKLK